MPLWILGKTYAPSGCAAPALLPEDPPNPLVLSGAQTKGFLGSSNGKESACNAEDSGSILGREDPLEKGMATHSSILAWEIPWRKEPGGLLVHQIVKSQIQLSDGHLHFQGKGRWAPDPGCHADSLGIWAHAPAVPVFSLAGRDALFGGALGEPVGKSVQTFRLLEQDSTEP